MSGFSPAWLDLRERADFAARAKDLAAAAISWLRRGSEPDLDPIIVDLGAGTGSTLRALTRLEVGNAVWRLVDHDGELLDEALRRHRKDHLIEDYQADLGVVAELPLGGARLVSASALFDLASREFVERLAGRVTHHRAGLYAALNYDGVTTWDPPHPLDARVLAAFNRDQTRDKGFGAALGPAATGCLRECFEGAGYRVVTAESPWLLESKDAALVRELARGIANAVAHGYGLDGNEVEQWLAFRLEHAGRGTCRVGHHDLLALPPDAPARS